MGYGFLVGLRLGKDLEHPKNPKEPLISGDDGGSVDQAAPALYRQLCVSFMQSPFHPALFVFASKAADKKGSYRPMKPFDQDLGIDPQ